MLNTSCEGCVFLKDGSLCDLNRLEKLKHKIEDGNIILERFCNCYRPKEWLTELSLEESNDLVKTVLKEVQPKVGFFIRFNRNLDKLKNTIDDIKNQTMQARYVVVINDAVEYNAEIQKTLKSSFDFDVTEHHILQLVAKPQISEFLIDEAFKHAKNGWIYVCDSGDAIDRRLIEKINHRVNVQMKTLVVVEPVSENLSGLLFQSALFKFLNGNRLKIFSDEKINDDLFLDKVRAYAASSHSDTFITWGEFNEQA